MTVADEHGDALRELERLEDWGRGSTTPRNRPLTGAEWLGLAVDALFVVAVPQIVLGFLTSPSGLTAVVLCVSVLSLCYCVATLPWAPELAAWRRQLWLASKMVTVSLTFAAVVALLLAGPWGLFVAVPAAPVALILAGGTALLRRGRLVGVVPVFILFALLGVVFLPGNEDTARAAGIAGVCVAALLVVLVVLSLRSPEDRRGR